MLGNEATGVRAAGFEGQDVGQEQRAKSEGTGDVKIRTWSRQTLS